MEDGIHIPFKGKERRLFYYPLNHPSTFPKSSQNLVLLTISGKQFEFQTKQPQLTFGIIATTQTTAPPRIPPQIQYLLDEFPNIFPSILSGSLCPLQDMLLI